MRRQQRPRNRNPDPRASNSRTIKNLPERNVSTRGRAFWLGWRRCARLFSALAGNGRACRSVELRALCNEVPRTPPGPEGSNGTGTTSGAADHPKFLSLKIVYGVQLSVFSGGKDAHMLVTSSLPCSRKTVESSLPLVFSKRNAKICTRFFY